MTVTELLPHCRARLEGRARAPRRSVDDDDGEKKLDKKRGPFLFGKEFSAACRPAAPGMFPPRKPGASFNSIDKEKKELLLVFFLKPFFERFPRRRTGRRTIIDQLISECARHEKHNCRT